MYDDKSTWCYGWSDGGKADKRQAVMTDGEYLTTVTQESFFNYRCAAAAIEFKTNKGRVFSYEPSGTSTKWKRYFILVKLHDGEYNFR